MELLRHTCKAIVINRVFSNQKDSRVAVFSGFGKPSILLVTSWMKLSVCLEDGIKKEVLCTHKSPGLQLRTIVKN